MTVAPLFKDLHKLVLQQQQAKARNELYDRLINKPFWIWNKEEHKQADIDTDGDCCFNHIIGLPQKDGIDKPLYDYEQLIFDVFAQMGSKHVWIKKATGLGISEFMLRFMAWLCLKDNSLTGSQMCIVTGPKIELAIALIQRMKALFRDRATPQNSSSNRSSFAFDTKTQCEACQLYHSYCLMKLTSFHHGSSKTQEMFLRDILQSQIRTL